MDSLEQVLAQVAKGDRKAFRQIYSRTSPQLFAMVRALMRNRERSEEILQEAFIRIWRNADKFDPAKGSAMAWLATLTRRVAIDDLRRRPEPVCSFDADETLLNSLAEESAAAPELEKDRLSFCLGRLREDYRRAILLAYVQGFTHEQLAQRLDRPLGTVKAWVHRGLASMKECMG
jgi:RNA polymerase sigma-70 factor (ECF subfamily)